MANHKRHTQFYRSIRDTRLAFSNLLYLFNPGSHIVFTWYEIIAGMSILTLLSLLAYLAVHLVYWSVRKEPPFSAALCSKLDFPRLVFSLRWSHQLISPPAINRRLHVPLRFTAGAASSASDCLTHDTTILSLLCFLPKTYSHFFQKKPCSHF